MSRAKRANSSCHCTASSPLLRALTAAATRWSTRISPDMRASSDGSIPLSHTDDPNPPEIVSRLSFPLLLVQTGWLAGALSIPEGPDEVVAKLEGLTQQAGIQGEGVWDPSAGRQGCAEHQRAVQKNKPIKPQTPWTGVDPVEFATAEWADWYNNQQIYEYYGDMAPAELEQAHYADLTQPHQELELTHHRAPNLPERIHGASFDFST